VIDRVSDVSRIPASAALAWNGKLGGSPRSCHRLLDFHRLQNVCQRSMDRRTILISAVPLLLAPLAAVSRSTAQAAGRPTAAALSPIFDRAAALEPLKTAIVARHGVILVERGYRGSSPSAPTNIKSVSKAIISALVGIAIDKGLLEGTEQKIAPLLRDQLPAQPDPRLHRITVGHLLSMQSGLERTSGANYGHWVSSDNWVRTALARPFVDEPGGQMLYSTGSTHLLSAILTRRSGRSTLQLARNWLGPLEDFSIAAWARDPQGIYLGGNQMAMSSKSLLAFGELYRNGGRTAEGRRLISPMWIEESWTLRTHSRFTGDGYGYGWFQRRAGGHQVQYAYGYGGQMLYIVPSLGVTVVMTSNERNPAGRSGYRDELHRLLEDIVGAVQTDAGDGSTGAY
jgi:CubicO group peptidase (beta-lactamase class C family)